MGLRRLTPKQRITSKYELNKEPREGHPFSIVIRGQLEKFQLTYAEYCLYDYIHNTSKTYMKRVDEYASGVRKDTLVKEYGFSKRYINELLVQLKEKGMITIHKDITQRLYYQPLLENWQGWGGVLLGVGDSYSRFDHTCRQRLKLTWIEYALLKIIQHLLEETWIGVLPVGARDPRHGHPIVTIKKTKLAEMVGGTNRETVSRAIKRLQERGWLRIVKTNQYTQQGNQISGIYPLIDIDKECEIYLDENGIPYIPKKTLLFEE